MLNSLRIAAIALSLCVGAVSTASAAECYASGTRVGTVQKISEKGLFKKSFEGELVQEGIRTKGDAGVTNVWHFSVLAPGIARQIDVAAASGKPVLLRYCESLLHNVLATSTPYVVTEVVPR